MDTILVLCQGRRQSALIARTLRYRQVYSLPLALDSPAETVLSYAPKGIVLSAPDGTPDALARLDPALLEAGVPVLALGGMVPALCRLYGGDASPAACPRGAVTLGLENDPLFADISGGERVLRSLSDLTLSECLLPLATATERPIGFRHRDLPLYALQYPIERNDPDAAQLLFNFASRICGAADTWDEDAMMNLAVERIRQAAPEGRVLCAVSGGVDSAVCARLASLAVGDRLMCVFVDTGLFRQGEPENVISTFMDSLGLVVAHVDASEAFLRALSGVRSRDDKERIAAQLMTQVLIKQLGELKIYGYKYDGYVSRIDSIASYYKLNMDMLDESIRTPLLYRPNPVYTKVKDEVPARYEAGAKAVNCLVADGCIIEGTVENSVLFRGVRVGKGAVVRNCILMQGVEVQDGAQLSNVISDKDAFIKRDRRIVGQESYPVVIEKNAVI